MRTVADKMARADTFGHIYESVVRSANKRVAEESRRVQRELVESMEQELRATRKQRDAAVAQFSGLNARLEGHLAAQQRVQAVALGGFCMGLISLSSVVLANLFEKR